MKTKIIIAIVSLAVIITTTTIFITNSKKHEHFYMETVISPTCTENGYTKFVCECGYNYLGHYTNPNGHTIVVDKKIEPTCEKNGLTEGSHCSICNEIVLEQQIINKTAHNYNQNVATNEYLKSNVTCTQSAVYYKSCSCGKKVLLRLNMAKN